MTPHAMFDNQTCLLLSDLRNLNSPVPLLHPHSLITDLEHKGMSELSSNTIYNNNHTIYNSAKRSLLMVKRFGRLGCYTSYTVCTCKIMQRYEVYWGAPTSMHHRGDCYKGTGTNRRQSPLSKIWSPTCPSEACWKSHFVSQPMGNVKVWIQLSRATNTIKLTTDL